MYKFNIHTSIFNLHSVNKIYLVGRFFPVVDVVVKKNRPTFCWLAEEMQRESCACLAFVSFLIVGIVAAS
jgi:hypothetical protein